MRTHKRTRTRRALQSIAQATRNSTKGAFILIDFDENYIYTTLMLFI